MDTDAETAPMTEENSEEPSSEPQTESDTVVANDTSSDTEKAPANNGCTGTITACTLIPLLLCFFMLFAIKRKEDKQ